MAEEIVLPDGTWSTRREQQVRLLICNADCIYFVSSLDKKAVTTKSEMIIGVDGKPTTGHRIASMIWINNFFFVSVYCLI